MATCCLSGVASSGFISGCIQACHEDDLLKDQAVEHREQQIGQDFTDVCFISTVYNSLTASSNI